MKFFASAAGLLIVLSLSATPACAATPYPGSVLTLEPYWGGGLSLPLSSGFQSGSRVFLGLQGSLDPALPLVPGLESAFHYWPVGKDAGVSALSESLWLGWRLDQLTQASFLPALKMTATWPFDGQAGQPVFGVGARLATSVRLWGTNSITLITEFQLAPEPRTPWEFCLAFSFKNTERFMIPVPPVNARLEPLPKLFSPDGDGVDDTVKIQIPSEHPESCVSWKMQIFDPKDHLFDQKSGEGELLPVWVWTGRNPKGELVESASDYRLTLTTRDRLGRVSEVSSRLTVDVLVIRDGERLKIRIPNIEFPANSTDFSKMPKGYMVKQNFAILTKLTEIFKRFPDYLIRIEGYGNVTHWQNPERAKKEQSTELIPLALQRAKAVKNALAELGIKPERMAVVGLGGVNPVVPFEDELNSWKNRRVEIILRKPIAK